MNGSVIQPYDNVWLVTMHYPDGRIVERGLSTDHVRFVTQSGKRYLSRVEGEAGSWPSLASQRRAAFQ